MTIDTRFVSRLSTDQDGWVEFWSSRIGFDEYPDVFEDPDAQLRAAVRLVQRELGGVLVR